MKNPALIMARDQKSNLEGFQPLTVLAKSIHHTLCLLFSLCTWPHEPVHQDCGSIFFLRGVDVSIHSSLVDRCIYYFLSRHSVAD